MAPHPHSSSGGGPSPLTGPVGPGGDARNAPYRRPVLAVPAPTLVLIDLDGTMVQYRNTSLLSLLEVAETIGSGAARLGRRCSGPRPDEAGPPTPGTDGDRPRPRFLGRRLLNALRYRPIPDLVSPAPGIFELLDAFRSNRIPVAVASNCLGAGYGRLVIEECGFAGHLSGAVFREDVARSKPDPGSLQLALERLGREVTTDDTIWCIGDRDKDMLAAEQLRPLTPARVVPVAYGPAARRALPPAGTVPVVISVSHHETRHVLERSLASRAPSPGRTHPTPGGETHATAILHVR